MLNEVKFVIFLIFLTRMSGGQSDFEYTISTLWDGDIPSDNATITVKFSSVGIPNATTTGEGHTPSNETGLVIEIEAPFYHDPVIPPEIPVGSMDKLWDYEVVEVFFLSESEKIYLETEFAPTGHYLLLKLNTSRVILEYELPLDNYKAEIDSETGRWTGRAVIPLEYIPKDVNKFNAYAIHKSDPYRDYMSLFPVPKGEYEEPNFHRLEYFQNINLTSLIGNDYL